MGVWSWRCRCRRREETAFLHFDGAFLKCANDLLDVFVGMRGGEENRETFEKMDSLQAQIIVEEAGEAFFAGETEITNALKIRETCGNTLLLEEIVDGANHVLHSVAHALLQLRTFGLKIFQHRLYGSKSQGMTHESAGEKCDADFREGIIAEIPRSAVERVHKLRFTGKDTDGHSSCDDFSISSQVGANSEERLASAGMSAEAGDHFIENQRGAGLLGDFANFLQIFRENHFGMAALNRLDQNCCQVFGILAN